MGSSPIFLESKSLDICFTSYGIFLSLICQILNLFLALLLNSFASDSLKKEEEESRLGMAFAKLKRAFFAVCCFCCCCLPRRFRNKVGDSSQSVQKEKQVEQAQEAQEEQETQEIKALHSPRPDAFIVVKETDQEIPHVNGIVNGGFQINGE